MPAHTHAPHIRIYAHARMHARLRSADAVMADHGVLVLYWPQQVLL
jgi:hypothetical protein